MSSPKIKIMLVEDDPFMSTLLSQELIKSGFDVAIAPDGEAAIAKFKEYKPDGMIFDILLPKKNGIEALREIRAIPDGEKVPTVVLSNLEEASYISDAQQLGVKSYLIKANVQLPEIVAKLKEALKAQE